MIVVSDTSPITYLITIGKLEILEQVFNELIIPEGVYQELIKVSGRKEIVDRSEWIRVEAVKNEQLVTNEDIEQGRIGGDGFSERT